ncbi:uncharacterized protein B0J16DRAFT_359346 [Fusarium flagelliforme]|uniref:uncharacterized protein n=1 Tax=Fusarium flagelliforme TaxID=2675880 RepID=UPI001E8DC9D9|nr:uncharacterized protein B0J16DRAFT_359346 [Fusarium flagelliforme]KAH7196651.1 hypothetical protein B0J16DRAFT_359346 [Fusarium flagelliforme]
MASNNFAPLRGKQKRRLYEPVILYKALNEITHEQGALKQVEVLNNPVTEEQKYHIFLHSLASVCDKVKRGKTVTSVAIIDGEEKFTYVFACNQVFDSDLEDTRDFLTTLLRTLSDFNSLPSKLQKPKRDEIFEMILGFNTPRIRCYLEALRKNIAQCLLYCQQAAGKTDHEVSRGLETLGGAIEQTAFEEPDDGLKLYLPSFNNVLQALRSCLTPRATNYIQNNAKAGRFRDGRSFECWSELRHTISRLKGYEKIVQHFINSEKIWPELFQEFVVVPIESTKPESNPLGRKSESAEAIIGRMCSDPASKERYLNHARSLEWVHLDDRVKNQCTRPSFKPYVHAEILILEWVMARSNVIFFQDWRYIGSSKGACQLCRYYFDATGQHGNIKTRPSHGNLYVNWRFPDIPELEGPFGRTRRQTILNSMMTKIREDAFRILVEKSSKGKRHDSSTHPLTSVLYASTDVRTDGGTRDLPDIDELGESFAKGLSLKPMVNSVGSDTDDEDGGILLG